MNNFFNKELVMAKEDNEKFNNSSKYWVCENDYTDNDIKVTDHCHITGKYYDSTHRDCSINAKLNHKIPAGFQNFKKYDSHLITQELCKFNLKINVMPN